MIQETYRKFQCQSCDFYIWPVLLGRDWSPEEVAELVTKKFIGPLNGFRSKQGRPFSAGLKLTDEFKIEFDFGQADGADADEPVDFSGQEALGACPKCGAACSSTACPTSARNRSARSAAAISAPAA